MSEKAEASFLHTKINYVNMKNKLLYILFLFIINTTVRSQVIAPANLFHMQFNTGINPNGGAYNTFLGPGNWSNWYAATGPMVTNIVGAYSPPSAFNAMVTTPPVGCGAANNCASNWPYCMWVTSHVLTCPPSTGHYACNPAFNNGAPHSLWFAYDFVLNTPVYQVNWQVFAGSFVEAIYVNGITAYTTAITNPTITPNHTSNGIDFRWCQNWKVGWNRIIIKVTSNPSWPNPCKFMGLNVLSYGPVSYSYPAITGPSIACAGQQYTFAIASKTTLGVPNPMTANYFWNKPAGWGAGGTNTNQVVFTAGVNSGSVGVYILSTTPNGTVCHSSAAIQVTVPPPLNITGVGGPVCAGNQVVLSASGGVGYSWYQPPGMTWFGIGPNAPVSPTITTTYTVKATTPIGNCSYSRTIVVPVLPKPIVNATAIPSIICQGMPTALQVTGTANKYNWAAPLNTSSTFFIITPMTSAIYNVTGTAPNGCTSTKAVTVTVLPTPVISATANPAVVCSGVSSTLTASGSPTITWVPPFTTTNPLVVTPGATTTYTAVGTAANGCTNTAQATVTVFNTPTVTSNPAFICTGISNTLIGTGAATYSWYIGGPNPATITNTNLVVLTPTAVTPYTLCGTAVNNCSACVTGTLTFGSPVPITAPNVTLCTNAGQCTTVNASSTMGAASYTWLPGAITGSSAIVCPTVSTIHTVNATSTLGCPNTATVDVKVISNCCPGNTSSLIPLPSSINGTHQNASYILTNNAVITNTTWFVNAEILVTPSVQITVLPGVELSLDNTHIFACGLNMWEGIKVQDGGRITTPAANTRLANSMIEDAHIAIELDNINSANVVPGLPAIEIQRVIFNKNFIGIKISNSDANLDSLELGIEGCVFASQAMPFGTYSNTPLSWPSSDFGITTGGLREPAAWTPTTGLIPPYKLNSFPPSFLKQPFNNQPGHIGIKIENIGDPFGRQPKPGVCFGEIKKYGFVNMDFNLFDGIGRGIEVTDASLTTNDNVFQTLEQYQYTSGTVTATFGGEGIYHRITDQRNARLNLPAVPSNNKCDGNRFWDCHKGIVIENVHDVWVWYSIFRSTHNRWLPNVFFPLGTTPGDVGVECVTNRFDFSVKESEFNNIRQGIVFSTPLALQPYYSVNGNGPFSGIEATGLNIERNYFGAEVLSTNPIPVEYMSDAIDISTPNPLGWSNYGQSSLITANKFDRVFRGIRIDGFEDHTTIVGGNVFLIEDDYIYGPPAKGWGVKVENKMDNMTIESNTIQSLSSIQATSVSLIYCENNYGNHSPIVQCNIATTAKYGFEFSSSNKTAIWRGNDLCDLFGGLALTNNGDIGPQGGSGGGHGNWWNNACIWSPIPPFPTYQTYTENSNPLGSELYVLAGSPTYEPVIHGSNVFTPYANGPTVIGVATNVIQDCTNNNPYLPAPSWRAGQATELSPNQEREIAGQSISVFPNPTTGKLTLNSTNKLEILSVDVRDIAGKLIYEGLKVSANNGELDLSDLPAALYFLDISSETMVKTHRKIIKTN